MNKSVMIAASIFGLSAQALAQPETFIKASVGQFDADLSISNYSVPDDGSISRERLDTKDTSFEFSTGIQFNKYFSASIGYRDLGQVGVSATSDGSGFYEAGPVEITESVSGMNLSISGHLPLNPHWAFTATAGWFKWYTDGEFKDGSGTIAEAEISGEDPFYGVGVSRKITQSLDASIEFFKYGEDSDVDVLQASLTYRVPLQADSRSRPPVHSDYKTNEPTPAATSSYPRPSANESVSPPKAPSTFKKRKPKGNMTRAAEEYERRMEQSQ